ncbi:MAG: hypothetical protein IT384_22835 [Deltaproteobacteria bacterium]|nr:hypothetical protein [Deltaproteobacteria bacterium]
MDAAARSRLLARYRSIAILTVVLGPVLVLLAIANVVMIRVLYWLLELQGTSTLPFGELTGASLAFGEASSLILGPLGAVLTWAGILAVRTTPAESRAGLVGSAWITVAAMLLLSGLWEVEAFRYHMDLGFHAGGVILHLLQALVVLQAIRFLNGAPLREAIAS